MATISIRVNDEDNLLIRKYAELNKMKVSDFIRQAVLERIEDEYDLAVYEEAIAEYNRNPVTYTCEEVERELGLL